MPEIQRFGWKRSLPQKYEFKFFPLSGLAALPASTNLQPHCPPVFDQGKLGSCHDAETEVLTENGWKLFSQCLEDDKLASVSPETGKLIFEPPLRLIKLSYNGKMFCGKHKFLDFCVTPDHKMLVKTWNEELRSLNQDFKFIEMNKVGWHTGLLSHVNYDGSNNDDVYTLPGVIHQQMPQRQFVDVDMKIWLMFLGIYLAEGTMLKGEIGRKHYKIQIAASKTREREFVRYILKEMTIKTCELPDRFTFENKRLYLAMKDLGLEGIKAPNKFVPKFVFNLPGEMIAYLLHGHFMGDGCEQHGIKSHYTSSHQLANDLQTLAFLSGKTSNVYTRKTRTSKTKDGRIIIGKYLEHRISITQKKNLSIERKKHIFEKEYNGYVYCAEMPINHTLVTRRNGKILVSGNCTANSSSALAEFVMSKTGYQAFRPSRLAIYYWTRVTEGDPQIDNGASLADTMKTITSKGIPHESIWWYDIGKFAVKPSAKVDADASKHIAATALSMEQNLYSMRACLAGGWPFVFGFTVYQSFEEGNWFKKGGSGIMPLPKSKEQIIGGHAVMAVGYDDAKQCIKVRNSWGDLWALGGYFYMPYSFIQDSNFCDDFWTLHSFSTWQN